MNNWGQGAKKKVAVDQTLVLHSPVRRRRKRNILGNGGEVLGHQTRVKGP